MLLILQTRWRGRWETYHTYWLQLDLDRERQWLQEHGSAFRVLDGNTKKIIEEWYPPGYRHNPRHNFREAHPDSDIYKKRFPNSTFRSGV